MTGVVGRAVRGAVAGAAGTLAMDLLWWSRSRRSGGDADFFDWAFSTGIQSFEEASPPGRVGQLAARAVGVELPDEAAGLTTNVVHWLTGIGYGKAHGLSPWRRHALVGGAVTGVGAFASSYAVLGGLGIYEPIWEYDADTLAQDLSAHLLYGLTAGITYALLGGDGVRSRVDA